MRRLTLAIGYFGGYLLACAAVLGLRVLCAVTSPPERHREGETWH